MITTLAGDLSLTTKIVTYVGVTPTNYYVSESRFNEKELLTMSGLNTKLLDTTNLGNLIVDTDFTLLDSIGILDSFNDLFVPTENAGTNDPNENLVFKTYYIGSSLILLDLDITVDKLEMYDSNNFLLGTVDFNGRELLEYKFFVLISEINSGATTITVKIHEDTPKPHFDLFDDIISQHRTNVLLNSSTVEFLGNAIDNRSYTMLSDPSPLTFNITGDIQTPLVEVAGNLELNGVIKTY